MTGNGFKAGIKQQRVLILNAGNQPQRQAFLTADMVRVERESTQLAASAMAQHADEMRQLAHRAFCFRRPKHFRIEAPGHFPRDDRACLETRSPAAITFQHQLFRQAIEIARSVGAVQLGYAHIHVRLL